MVPAVTPLRSPSTAPSCARIDSRPDTAKIGSADRVEVHHARLLAAIGIRKTFPHGLGLKRKRFRCGWRTIWVLAVCMVEIGRVRVATGNAPIEQDVEVRFYLQCGLNVLRQDAPTCRA